ncbi:LacI family DNA-binding transcriptional regulator [Alicyclobacillus fodiniaquatilis]|uniref:LacI family DNA-binding transcriptional regulator n=1 Tax=Alicyclobacillus fodiniaquatilis TaxID=1661150 RepID=A0ABW4JE98_9BACL
MITIYDIAKRAGVSVTTVSRVLNGYADVSPSTRRKVQHIVHELGYRPNAMARGLTTKRSMSVGVFFHDNVNTGLSHPFFLEVINGFKETIGAEGYDLLFFANDTLDNELKTFEARAKHRNVDGLLLWAIPEDDPSLAALVMSSIPSIILDLDLTGPCMGNISCDNFGGAVQAMNFLLENGHRNIAFVSGLLSTHSARERLLGYQHALQLHGIPYRPEWMLEGDYTEKSGYAAAKRLLKSGDLPTAVFCSSDMMAIGVMKALEEGGMLVGEELSLIGFDDIMMASYITPGLTTIRQKKHEMGVIAARALLELIENSDKVPEALTMDTELVVRGTVRPLAL